MQTLFISYLRSTKRKDQCCLTNKPDNDDLKPGSMDLILMLMKHI